MTAYPRTQSAGLPRKKHRQSEALQNALQFVEVAPKTQGLSDGEV